MEERGEPFYGRIESHEETNGVLHIRLRDPRDNSAKTLPFRLNGELDRLKQYLDGEYILEGMTDRRGSYIIKVLGKKSIKILGLIPIETVWKEVDVFLAGYWANRK